MRTVTANSLATGALALIGAWNGATETPDTANLAQAVSILNDLIDDWATQALTIPCNTREMFSLAVGQETVTIGSGGLIDTVRPQKIDAASILQNYSTPQSVTSIASSGSTATVTKVAHGYVTGQVVMILGAAPAVYNGAWVITQTSANTFTYKFPGSSTSPATGTITAQDAMGGQTQLELYMGQWTYAGWIAQALKGLTNLYPLNFYYNPTFEAGLGTIYLWPNPTQVNILVVYAGRILTQFDEAAPTTSVILPPAYARALRYNLAVELYPLYAPQTNLDLLQRGAMKAFGDLKTQNDRTDVLSMGEAGFMFGGWNGSYIDFLTGP